MNHIKQALLLLGTLALVALGAVMPWLFAWIEDGRTGGLQEEFDLDAVSLTLHKDAGVGDTLRLLSEGYHALGWSGDTVLDPGGALRAASDISVQLAEKGLLDERFTLPSGPASGVDVMPLLMVSEDGSLSAIVWYCGLAEKESRYFFLDDATGKMVGGWFQRSGKLSVPELNEQLVEWVDFFEDYYGVGVADMRWTSENPVVDGVLMGGSTFVMTLQPEQGAPVEFRLVFYEMSIEFNAPKEPTDADSMAKGG